MEEIWKPVVGWESLYEVSSFGRLRSLHYKKIRLLKNNITNLTKNYSYCKVILYNKKFRKTYSVHRLVATAFIPNLKNKLCVNHKDSNPQNNNVNNLEWCTQIENVKHATREKRMSFGAKNGNSKLKEDDVKEIINLLNKKEKGVKIAKKFKVTTATISDIKNRKIWKCITLLTK